MATGESSVSRTGRGHRPDGRPQGDPARKPEHRRGRAVRAAAGLLRFLRTLFHTLAAAWDKDATERAAALTYYAVLAIFPALLMTVSLLGLTGGEDDGSLSAGVTTLLPAESRPVVAQALLDMARDRSASLSLSVIGGAGAIWSACAYASVFRRGLHIMHGVTDRRPAWRTVPRVVITSVTLLVLLVCSALCLVVTGVLARRTGTLLNMNGATLAAWRGLRWPLLLVVASALVLVLFRSGPRGSRSLRALAPGGALAVGLWLATSAGFAAYTSHLGTYNRLYGPLAGTVVFLVWLWFSNLALLVGAHFNVEHSRALAARARPAPEPAPADVQGG
ncbi:YihY/virulence factor BrkB family protein [Actinacidiphila sp. ITFR-21]|uniref:YihY/virulence factor BrkB family protein n=1 Tax=Actinacidiphila sp. ITFR-21 TaxID=3075199 RepID=UPI00288AF805|nr:YihY/virulence factor BrkB family protein [Streptomyces sp. ITFR-21]WNI14444.1 YihY/virulence factor BrkB family protein [Streptomyces sp. ITFR-21]